MNILRYVTGIIKLKGDSDNTRIGNVSDRLKVSNRNIPENVLVHIDRRFSNGGSTDMGVDGSLSPQDFTFGPPAGQTWYVENLQVLVIDSGTTGPNDFGAINDGVNNGFQILQEIDSVEYELGNFQNNASLSLCFAQSSFASSTQNGWYDSRNFYQGVKDFNNMITLSGDDGDQLIARVRDNLTGLDNFIMVGRAYRILS